MTATSHIAKVTAKTALKDNWTCSIAASAVLLFTVLLTSFISSLLSTALGQIAGVSVYILLSLFVSAPLFLGVLRFFWRLLFSAGDVPISVFYYFSCKKLYAKAFKLTVSLVLRLVFFSVILYTPSFVVKIFSETAFYDWADISIPLWTSNLYYFSMFLSGLATVALIFISLRYYLAPVLLVADEEIEVLEAIHMSVTISKTTILDFLGLFFSMIGWILLSVFFLPILFTLPYILTVFVVHVRFAVADYNKRTQPTLSDSDQTFVTEG